MFQNFTFKDLTDEINPITNHWKNENIGFDAIYTGYLGSLKQIDMVKRSILELYRADIVKHAEGYEMKVEQIFDDIPAQLQGCC